MPIKYLFFAFVAVFIGVGNTIVSKLAAGAIPPGVIAFERWFIAFGILTPFVARDAWRHRWAIGRNLPKLAVLGLLGMAVCHGVGYYAAAFTSATNMAILLSLVPLLTLALSVLILREKPSAQAMVGTVLSLAGVFVVLGKGNPSLLLSQGIGQGDGLMLLVGVSYAAYGVLLRRWSIHLPAFTSLYAQIGCAVVFLLPNYLLESTATYSLPNIAMTLYAAVPGSIISPLLWMLAVSHLGAGRTTVFMNLIPILTAVGAMVLLGETLHAYHLLGGGLTLAGTILSQRKPLTVRGQAAPAAAE